MLDTVGMPGELGVDVRRVVSVAMLTDGWDATTVTHVLGVRAFGTHRCASRRWEGRFGGSRTN